jgi:hypothetical protein
MLRSWLGLASAFFLVGVIPFAEPAHAVEPDPANVLKTHGLKASGWVYVLESEADFHSKIADARSLYQEWTTARGRVYEQEQEAQAVQYLGAQSNAVKQNIAQLRRQMSSGGYGGRRASQFRRMQNMGVSAEINQEQASLNLMNQQLTQLKKNAPKPQDKQRVAGEASTRRQALHDAVDELVKASDEIDRTYRELHGAKEIESALSSLGAREKAKLKLGPSHEHATDLKILQKLRHELSLAGSPVAAPATSGVKHHAKGTSKSRKKVSSAAQGFPANASSNP